MSDSPGTALTERHMLEQQVAAAGRTALGGFLDAVQAGALSSERMTLGAVLQHWVPVVDALTATLGSDAARFRLTEASVPGAAFETVSAVLGQGSEEGWSQARLKTELTTALAADTGTTRRTVQAKASMSPSGTVSIEMTQGLATEGVNWAAQMDRLARTEATAAYGSATLDALVKGGFTEKRWVAHHDKATRPSHLAADGQTVPLSASFLVGGFAMMTPADFNAPSSETSNCRCVMVGVAQQLTDVPADARLPDFAELRAQAEVAKGAEWVRVTRERQRQEAAWLDRHLTLASGGKASDDTWEGLGPNGPAVRNRYVMDDAGTLKMNAGLRAGRGATARVKAMDEVLAQSRVTQPIAVWRSEVLPLDVVKSYTVGMERTNLGFSSTDLDRMTAEFYGKERLKDQGSGVVVLFEHVVEPGSHAVNMGYNEIVLNRGSVSRVLDVKQEGDTWLVRMSTTAP